MKLKMTKKRYRVPGGETGPNRFWDQVTSSYNSGPGPTGTRTRTGSSKTDRVPGCAQPYANPL